MTTQKEFRQRAALEALITEREEIITKVRCMDNSDAIYPQSYYRTAQAELKAVKLKLQRLAAPETELPSSGLTENDWQFLALLVHTGIMHSPATDAGDSTCDELEKLGLLKSLGGRQWTLTGKVELRVTVKE